MGSTGSRALGGSLALAALLFAGSALYPESHALGVGGAIVGVGGILAAARGYWASSTKRVRERIGQAMNVIEKTLHHPEG